MTEPIYVGSCQCAQVTYQATEHPQLSLICHCIDCQKLSASAWSPTLVFRANAITISGATKPWERLTASGKVNIAHFCPECGNRIYHVDPAYDALFRVKGGTLDRPSIPPPQAHVWVSRKQPWVEIPAHLPQFGENMTREATRELFGRYEPPTC